MKRDKKTGRFKPTHGAYIDDKGYIRISAGPYRGKRLHTMIAEAKIGRELKPDEDVHHIDGNKLNVGWKNLQVLGHKDHGAVSRKQAWYFRQHDIKLKDEWDEYMDSGGAMLSSREAII